MLFRSVCGTAIECGMDRVELTFGLREDMPLSMPVAHTAAGWLTMGLGSTVDEAVFVALDSPDGKPTPVPRWEPRDDEDRRLQDYARRLMELSKTMEQQVAVLRPAAAPLA